MLLLIKAAKTELCHSIMSILATQSSGKRGNQDCQVIFEPFLTKGEGKNNLQDY